MEPPPLPPSPPPLFGAQALRAAAELHESRNAEYGDLYRRSGELMHALLDGAPVTVQTPEEWSRLVNFVMLAGKFGRYGRNFIKGGHDDSLSDTMAYSAMQLHLDTLARQAQALFETSDHTV